MGFEVITKMKTKRHSTIFFGRSCTVSITQAQPFMFLLTR